MHAKSQPASGPKIKSLEQQRIREKQRGMWRYLPGAAEWVQGLSSEPNLLQSSDSECNVRPYRHLHGRLWTDPDRAGNGQTTYKIQNYYPCAKDRFPQKSNKPPVSFSCPQPIWDPTSTLSYGICFCLPSDHFLKVSLHPLEHTKWSWCHSRN